MRIAAFLQDGDDPFLVVRRIIGNEAGKENIIILPRSRTEGNIQAGADGYLDGGRLPVPVRNGP